MKSNLLAFFIFFGQLLSAQTFTEVLQFIPFEGAQKGSIAFSDVDGDNDQDVLITGQNSSGVLISKLYTNDGMGSFTEVIGTPFEGVYLSSIDFSDVDGDNDQDVLIVGGDNSGVPIAKLYTSNGAGHFTEVIGTPFDEVAFSSVAFSDVDGDNDQDVLITGQNSSWIQTAKLYTNDGAGSFTEVTSTPFEGVQRGSIAFSDVDGDNDQDVFIAGRNSSGTRIAKLYINDGAGSFTEMTGTPFKGVEYSSIAFSDVDGDNDQDVLITGQNSSWTPTVRLYINDGTGSFTGAIDTPFEGVYRSSIAFSDVDGDNDQDVLITGQNSSETLISKLYTNDGAGNFTEVTGTPFDGVEFSSIAFSDVDGDNDQDVLITGQNSSGDQIARLYTNDGIINSISDASNVLRFELALYPNPTSSHSITISILSESNSAVSISVFDLNGRLLSQQQEQLGVGVQTFPLDVSSLHKGAYILQLSDGVKKGVQKFLTQ